MAVDDLTTSPQAAAPQPIDIEAWTEQATAAMGSVAISAPAPALAGTSVLFDIPLDEHSAPARPATTAQVHTVYKRTEPVRRDTCALVVEAHPVDDRPVLDQAEQPWLGIAGLRARGPWLRPPT